jgi:hypothetical protein
MSSNPIELASACTQALQRAAGAMQPGNAEGGASKALSLMLTGSSLLAELAHASSLAPGECVAPLGAWPGNNPAHALQFMNTAPLPPTASTAPAAPAPAAAPAPISALDASRFDTALEALSRRFAAAAKELMQAPPKAS